MSKTAKYVDVITVSNELHPEFCLDSYENSKHSIEISDKKPSHMCKANHLLRIN